MADEDILEKWLVHCAKEQVIILPDRVLGRGSFGTVYMGTYRRKPVACKVIVPSRLTALGTYVNSYFLSELTALRFLNHENIITHYKLIILVSKGLTEETDIGHVIDEIQMACVVMEEAFCDLSHYVGTWVHRPIDEATALGFFLEIAEGLRYMHGEGWAHRDLKSDCVLITYYGVAKIADFSYATKKAEDDDVVGCQEFEAPEITVNRMQFEETPYLLLPADVWALGYLLYWLVFDGMPYEYLKDEAGMSLMLENKRQGLFGYQVTPSLRLHWLLVLMLAYDPQQRPTMDEVLESPWVQHGPQSI